MHGYIGLKSASCGIRKQDQGRLRIATSAYGASYIALLSHVLRPTKRVNIQLFCEHCVDMKKLKEIQISHLEVIFKESGDRKTWTGQEWLAWVSSAQYKELKNDLRHGGKIYLLFPLEPCAKHQDGHTRHRITALPITSSNVKKKPYGCVNDLFWTGIRSGLRRTALGIL